MKKKAAALLLYRGDLEVMLVHPSGEYNKDKPWSIPKGEIESNESLDATARRELFEETGINYTGPVVFLGDSTYRSKKKCVFCFAAAFDAVPSCASWEIDAAKWMNIEEAEKVIHEGQAVFLKELRHHVKRNVSTTNE